MSTKVICKYIFSRLTLYRLQECMHAQSCSPDIRDPRQPKPHLIPGVSNLAPSRRAPPSLSLLKLYNSMRPCNKRKHTAKSLLRSATSHNLSPARQEGAASQWGGHWPRH